MISPITKTEIAKRMAEGTTIATKNELFLLSLLSYDFSKLFTTTKYMLTSFLLWTWEEEIGIM